jgi:hypothetical protein
MDISKQGLDDLFEYKMLSHIHHIEYLIGMEGGKHNVYAASRNLELFAISRGFWNHE